MDNDWGLRYYLEADHALPARKGQHVRPGDIIVSSELGHNVEFTAPLSPLAAADIESAIPLRLIGLNSHSGYSTVAEGYLPFGVSTDPIDRVSARMVMERHPTLEYLTMDSPAAAAQIVSGIFPNDRWMSQAGIVVLKSPAVPKKLRAEFYIPPNAPARRVTLLLDGREVASHTYPGPGRLHAHFRRTPTGLHRRSPRGPDLHRPARSARARHGPHRRRLRRPSEP